MAKPQAWLSWSSGKDSAWALQVVRQQGEHDITALLTTVTTGYGRVSMHAVREELLEAQTEAAGLPLVKVPIPPRCSNAIYEQAMAEAMERAQAEGVRHILFGDLFLEDVRAYREEKLAAVNMQAVFPLWGLDTRELAQQMVAAGVRAHLTCVDPKQLAPAFAGRIFDAQLLSDLPESVDPCGERGEFHTFCFAGPMFTQPIPVQTGEVVEREGFVFSDLLPAVVKPPAQTTD